jgi:3-oxo-Delta1-steroid hydratase/dehydrogenase large subunit
MAVVKIPKSLDELPVSKPRWVGQPMRRVEDPMLVTGRAQFADNIVLPDMLHCAVLRSPHAHARIKSIDFTEAKKMPGVVEVVTGEEAKRWMALPSTLVSRPGEKPEVWASHCIATDKVRFVGEAVAAVAAESRYIAEDALERIVVEYEPLPPVVDAERALEPGSSLVYEQNSSNLIFEKKFAWGDVEKVFQEADKVFTERFVWNRVSGNTIETASGIAQWNPLEESVKIWMCAQITQSQAGGIAGAFRISPQNVIIEPTHGGSFFGGGKGASRSIETAILLSRKCGGRPVKYVMDRRELIGGLSQAWDRKYEVSLAVKKDGTVTGVKIKFIDNFGATVEGVPIVQLFKPFACFTGQYGIRTAEYEVKAVATNKTPQIVYRGAGPPPHNWALEQMMDIAARGLGMDPTELRRKNFIPPDQFPYKLFTGALYDSGNYEAALNKLLEMSDYQALRRYQAEARKQGRCVGIGVVTTIEPGGVVHFGMFAPANPMFAHAPFPEGAVVRMEPSGEINVGVGFPICGQGQYTFVTQLMADYFCVEPSKVHVKPFDNVSGPRSMGPGGSRQAVTLSGAVLGAADLLRQKMVKVAARLLQANPEEVELMDGFLRVKAQPERNMPVAQVAVIMCYSPEMLPPDVDGDPEACYVFDAREFTKLDEQGLGRSYLTAASASHLLMLEIDRKTGKVEILKYFIVDDCGTRLNPANVEGMIQGGVAQGVGAALLEEVVYDENGQQLATTFMDYLLPTIEDVPMTEKAAMCTPSPYGPLGAKGTGEGSLNTTPAAIFCALNDALAPVGLRANELPATPLRLWKLMQQAKPQ